MQISTDTKISFLRVLEFSRKIYARAWNSLVYQSKFTWKSLYVSDVKGSVSFRMNFRCLKFSKNNEKIDRIFAKKQIKQIKTFHRVK